MNGIIGMTNLLLDTELNVTQRGYAETVTNSADSLLQIINDILDFSKIEAGKIELEKIPFDLQLLCEEVCEMMSFKANEKGIELLLRYPHGTPRFCIGDPGRVRQILFNLVGNSIKFTGNGHVMLSLQSQHLEDDKLQFHVEIEDTGIGIPEDKVDLIFNKFSQADQSTARKFGGTGLGLSICRELTHMMGGDIGARSTYGIGSTFWFDITLTEDKADIEHFHVPQDEVMEGLRILVVDDNEPARTIVREQLTQYGIEIVEAHDGKSALTILDNDTKFDIAILDHLMAHMDGVELAQRIKDNPKTKDISLLMLTSTPTRGDKQRLEKIGFAGYLSKPLASWHLRDAVAALAEARKSGKTIPMVTQHSLKEAKAGIQQKASDKLRFSNVHILLAEDNPVNQMVATTMLEKYGIKITPAGDGDEAVKQLKQRSFDLVFMDCQMPVMDGYEATEMIRRLESHQHRTRTPIIAFTANAMKGDSEKCLAAGMDDYITKPVRQADMERVLMKWLPQEKRNGEGSDGKPTQLQKTAGDILDMEIVNDFATLMGNALSNVITRHIELAEKYIKEIRKGLDTKNYGAISDAAHPLKSSSYQIGTIKVADIAKDIEHLANLSEPDFSELESLVEQIEKAQIETDKALEQYIKSASNK
jgi:CheY-like chemotaxis protein